MYFLWPVQIVPFGSCMFVFDVFVCSKNEGFGRGCRGVHMSVQIYICTHVYICPPLSCSALLLLRKGVSPVPKLTVLDRLACQQALGQDPPVSKHHAWLFHGASRLQSHVFLPTEPSPQPFSLCVSYTASDEFSELLLRICFSVSVWKVICTVYAILDEWVLSASLALWLVWLKWELHHYYLFNMSVFSGCF